MRNAEKQAIQWLHSMCLDPDSFNAINAENCLAIISKLKRQNRSLGAHFCNLKRQRNRLSEQLEQAEKEKNRTKLFV